MTCRGWNCKVVRNDMISSAMKPLDDLSVEPGSTHLDSVRLVQFDHDLSRSPLSTLDLSRFVDSRLAFTKVFGGGFQLS